MNLAIMSALSCSRSFSLDSILSSNKMFESTWRDLKSSESKNACYSLDNYNSNFNSKNNFRTQVYNSSRSNMRYSRKHN